MMRKSLVLLFTVICLNGCAALAVPAVSAAAAGFGSGAAKAIFSEE